VYCSTKGFFGFDCYCYLRLITAFYFRSLVIGHIEENSRSITLCSGGWFNTNCLPEYSYRKYWRG